MLSFSRQLALALRSNLRGIHPLRSRPHKTFSETCLSSHHIKRGSFLRYECNSQPIRYFSTNIPDHHPTEHAEKLSTSTSPTLPHSTSSHEISPFHKEAALLNPSILDETTVFPRFSSFADWWAWYRVDPPPYTRFSRRWWASFSWLMLIFSVTGSIALQVVRAVLKFADIDASLFRGEWHHRVLYFLLMLPTYNLMTLVVGVAMGRPVFARAMVRRMLGRWLRLFGRGNGKAQ